MPFVYQAMLSKRKSIITHVYDQRAGGEVFIVKIFQNLFEAFIYGLQA